MITFIFKGDFKYPTLSIYILCVCVCVCCDSCQMQKDMFAQHLDTISNDLVILKLGAHPNELRAFVHTRTQTLSSKRIEQCENVLSLNTVLDCMKMQSATNERTTKPQPSNAMPVDKRRTLNTKSQIKLLRNNHNLLKMLPLNNFVLIRKIVCV